MPKREDIKKVLVIGSGPIVIGQAAEFDYAGTQAFRGPQEEGGGGRWSSLSKLKPCNNHDR